jgi:pimeloyl-ACP methyl ester carboxylesterase
LLADAGANVFMPDRRGSGLNTIARGDTPNMQRWLDDLDEHAAWVRREFGAQRVDVVGVSWGGKLAMAWADAHPQSVGRVLLIAPGVFPRVRVSLLRKLQVGASLLTDSTHRYPIPLNDARLFTMNPAGRAFIDGDRAKLSDATARFFYCSTKLDAALARIATRGFRSRVDLVLAGNDRIIRNDLTRNWIERIAYSERNFGIHEFAAASHTLEFESSIASFESFLRGWIKTDD